MEIIKMIKIAVVTLVLLVCSYEDIKERKVPILIILGGASIVLLLTLIGRDIGFVNCILGCLVGVVMMIVSKATKGALGLGDALLTGMIGAALGGFATLLVLFYGLFITAIVSIVLLILKRVKKNSQMPFVPFMLIGFLGVVFS